MPDSKTIQSAIDGRMKGNFREFKISEIKGLTEPKSLVILTPRLRVETHAGHNKIETHTGQSGSPGRTRSAGFVH